MEKLQEDRKRIQAVVENPDNVKFTPTLGINFGVSITDSTKYFITNLIELVFKTWGRELKCYFQTLEKNNTVKIDKFSNGLKQLEQKLDKFSKIQDPKKIPYELLTIVENILGRKLDISPQTKSNMEYSDLIDPEMAWYMAYNGLFWVVRELKESVKLLRQI